MNESIVNEKYQHILELLRRKKMKEALARLRDFLVDVPGWELSGELSRIETSYDYMLQYMSRNIADPERPKLYTKLLIDALSVADRARILKAEVLSTRQYYAIRSYRKMRSEQTIASLMIQLEAYTEEMAVSGLLKEGAPGSVMKIRKTHEEAQQALFEFVWTGEFWKTEDEAQAKEMLSSVLLPQNDLCLFVSAVTLSLMECFDLRKLMWLFDAYEDKRAQISQRALVGLAFAFQLYNERMLLYPEIVARISLLNELPLFGEELCRVQIQMLLTQETTKIEKKIREEIIPEVMKSVNPRSTKFDVDESDDENDDRNPDWMNDFESSVLGDKLKEMNELQMEGADIYMTTFSQLKNYPFFKPIANWFYPFDKQHSAITDGFETEQAPLLNMLLQSGFFCDSDKYSMCFTAKHIPKEQVEAMMGQMSEQQMNEFMDEQKSDSLKKYFDRHEVVSNQYLHNLYRFFKLFPRRHEFRDIFREPLRLYRYLILKPVLCRAEHLRKIADYLFGKEYLGEAASIYQTVLELEGDNAELYQKIGYCRQKEQRFNEAIEAYLKADMLRPDNLWTNRHLATCYRVQREYEKALDYYRRVEAVKPDNKSVLFCIGSCLAELGRYDEAMNYFFKLNFLETDYVKAWRAIGWCSFVSGKYEQAVKYYRQVIDKNPKAGDYLNAGHVAWCSGDVNKAVELYKKSMQMTSGGREEFLKIFNKDIEWIMRQGIEGDDVPLMLDLLEDF